MRLAQRKAQLKSTREREDDVEGDEETQEREVKEGHARFARMFEGIEDSSSSGSERDDAEGEEVVGKLEVGGEEGGDEGKEEGEREEGKGAEGEGEGEEGSKEKAEGKAEAEAEGEEKEGGVVVV
ncbi:hypothetical protein CC80DRAFT_495337 [Byssothecium circinans]|uniref:Uncharacterized protein n=1 Tax=Byssothecium circinans TaxID=147558 RepID=A0A6A5TJM2_9PLEO|nr:hypothetical protein CC80DRAFT_495337 [Byssothecium circinans]